MGGGDREWGGGGYEGGGKPSVLSKGWKDRRIRTLFCFLREEIIKETRKENLIKIASVCYSGTHLLDIGGLNISNICNDFVEETKKIFCKKFKAGPFHLRLNLKRHCMFF